MLVRYASCLEAGMKPELVLSEEKKEQRFWKKIGKYPLSNDDICTLL